MNAHQSIIKRLTAHIHQLRGHGLVVRRGTLRHQTGMRFGSGTARKFRRAWAKQGLELAP